MVVFISLYPCFTLSRIGTISSSIWFSVNLFLSRCVLNYAKIGRFYGDLVEDGVREAGLRDADSEEKRTRKTGGLGGLFFGGWRHFV